jgi:hypothetical protein
MFMFLRASHSGHFLAPPERVGFPVLYEADIVLKFWLPMGGLGHCRTLKSDSLRHMKSLINVKQWV